MPMILNDKNQKCQLVSYVSTQDASGFAPDEPEMIKQTVWCKVSSVSGTEIAAFGQNNIKPSMKVTLWAAEYADQDEVIVGNSIYGVYRTYRTGMDEIELYLERKGGVSDGEN